MISQGWLLDLYVQGDSLVLWFRLRSGEILRLTDFFSYRFYAQGAMPALRVLGKTLAPYVRHTAWTHRVEFWSGKTITVLEITFRSLEKLFEVQRILSSAPPGLTFYNCDLGIPQYYAWEKGLFPLCFCEIEIEWERTSLRKMAVLDSPWDPDARLPDLKIMELELTSHPQIPLDRGNSLRISVEGLSFELEATDKREFLKEINRLLERFAPDLILSRYGDDRIFPFLWRAAQKEKMALALDRDPCPPGRVKIGQGRSYFSYGQILYQGASFPLYGRIYLDQDNSFFYRESGLKGTLFLSRLTKLPVQTLARATPGTAITSMQLDLAVKRESLSPGKKGAPKPSRPLGTFWSRTRGGWSFSPLSGFGNRWPRSTSFPCIPRSWSGITSPLKPCSVAAARNRWSRRRAIGSGKGWCPKPCAPYCNCEMN